MGRGMMYRLLIVWWDVYVVDREDEKVGKKRREGLIVIRG